MRHPSWPFFSKDEKVSYEDWLVKSMKNEWLGLVLRYDVHWGHGEKPPAFVITKDTTLREFQDAVDREITQSGDDHHIFIESFNPNGMWLDIGTGS